jgi:hypothetical protein
MSFFKSISSCEVGLWFLGADVSIDILRRVLYSRLPHVGIMLVVPTYLPR